MPDIPESLDLMPIEARDADCREHDWRCRDVSHGDRRALLAEVRRLRDELADVSESVDFGIRMAQERERPYVEQWQRETGKPDTLPDYSDLLHWVIGKNERLRTSLDILLRACEHGAYVGRSSDATRQARALLDETI